MPKNWTGLEVAELRKAIHAGETMVEFARKSGRSYSSVRNKVDGFRRAGAPLPDTRLMKLSRVDLGRAPPIIRKIFKIAKEGGYTLDRIAKISGIAPGTVSNMLHHGNPTIGNLQAVANAVGCELRIVRIFGDHGD